MRRPPGALNPRRTSGPDDKPALRPRAPGMLMPASPPGGQRILTPEGTGVDPFQQQYQEAYDRYMGTLDAQQALNTEAAQLLPEYIEPMRMDRNTALTAGGIAALAALLGANNAPEALAQFMGGANQVMDQRTQDARAAAADRVGRLQAGLGARRANLQIDQQRAQAGMEDAMGRMAARSEAEEAAFRRSMETAEFGLKADEQARKNAELEQEIRKYEDGTLQGQLSNLVNMGMDPEVAMASVFSPFLQRMYEADEAKTKAWVASQLAETEVEMGLLGPAEMQARIDWWKARPAMEQQRAWLGYSGDMGRLALGFNNNLTQLEIARMRDNRAAQPQAIDPARQLSALSSTLQRLYGPDGDPIPGMEGMIEEVQGQMRMLVGMMGNAGVSPGATSGAGLGGSLGALGVVGPGLTPDYAPFNPFGGSAPGGQAVMPGPQVPEQFRSLIQSAADEVGLDPALLASLAKVESGFNPTAVSPKGARGLFQLMPGTARELGVTDPNDPVQNARGGARYLAQMLQRFNGDIRLALAAYNAGPGAVERHGGVPPFQETQEFIQRVLAAYGGQ